MKIYKSSTNNFTFKLIGNKATCIVSASPDDEGYYQVGQTFPMQVTKSHSFIEITFQNYLNEIENDN